MQLKFLSLEIPMSFCQTNNANFCDDLILENKQKKHQKSTLNSVSLNLKNFQTTNLFHFMQQLFYHLG